MPLGPRQQQIVGILSHGGCSLLALEHQCQAERGQLRDALKRLVDQGLVTVSRRHNKLLDGAMVELSRSVLGLADGSLRRPKGDVLARFASITGLLRPR